MNAPIIEVKFIWCKSILFPRRCEPTVFFRQSKAGRDDRSPLNRVPVQKLEQPDRTASTRDTEHTSLPRRNQFSKRRKSLFHSIEQFDRNPRDSLRLWDATGNHFDRATPKIRTTSTKNLPKVRRRKLIDLDRSSSHGLSLEWHTRKAFNAARKISSRRTQCWWFDYRVDSSNRSSNNRESRSYRSWKFNYRRSYFIDYLNRFISRSETSRSTHRPTDLLFNLNSEASLRASIPTRERIDRKREPFGLAWKWRAGCHLFDIWPNRELNYPTRSIDLIDGRRDTSVGGRIHLRDKIRQRMWHKRETSRCAPKKSRRTELATSFSRGIIARLFRKSRFYFLIQKVFFTSDDDGLVHS